MTMIALALLRAIENAITGLLEIQEIFLEASESLIVAGFELLSQAAIGQLDQATDYPEDLIEVVAHLARVNRTINLLCNLGWRS